MFTSDFVLNGSGIGEIGQGLEAVRFEAGLLRPFIETDNGHPYRGHRCVTVNTGRTRFNPETKKDEPVLRTHKIADLVARGVWSPVFNAMSLPKDAWIQMDKVVIKAARERLRAWDDLKSASSVGGFNAMGKSTFEYEAMNDPGEAVVDMDGLSAGRTMNHLFKLRSIPLPITHSDFWFSERRLAISRNTSTPFDTTAAEAAGRRVAEMIERTVIGTETGMTYGPTATSDTRYDNTSKVYGYTNHPNRITKTNLTTPTGSNPEATVADVLSMRQSMFTKKFYGPFMIYHSTDWDTFLDNDYARLGGNNATMTLRDRLRAIEGIQDVRRLDFLDSTTNPYTLIMVEMTSQAAQAINGMEITTVMWETHGGMKKNWKVMAIQVPLIKYDYNGYARILHATTS